MSFVKINLTDGLGTIRNELLGKNIHIPPRGECSKDSLSIGIHGGKHVAPTLN